MRWRAERRQEEMQTSLFFSPDRDFFFWSPPPPFFFELIDGLTLKHKYTHYTHYMSLFLITVHLTETLITKAILQQFNIALPPSWGTRKS